MENVEENKNHSNVRELVLKPIEGKGTLNSKGLIDNRLFKGDNHLHAYQGEDGLWFMRQDQGHLPEVLKEKFTTFSKLLTFAKNYYDKRNVEIVEVKDKHEHAA
jgi:hypothetical protein